ncbi:hypothetical protein GCM10007868_24090 [Gluconobacter frateurii]|uniref:Uncharacterized protein n=1 Tax=Gluconobacter frateurii NRIC 0228 TaxID=1307946 RepID=A0ABQ0Q7C0_9PROT|nr:hypothetical protein AA0228_0101 [Gluconobacter frateurii NRIC 0228]GLP91334.1 hypothetical protein GCM10007868_24090 [Gluconobacter frateurii]
MMFQDISTRRLGAHAFEAVRNTFKDAEQGVIGHGIRFVPVMKEAPVLDGETADDMVRARFTQDWTNNP